MNVQITLPKKSEKKDEFIIGRDIFKVREEGIYDVFNIATGEQSKFKLIVLSTYPSYLPGSKTHQPNTLVFLNLMDNVMYAVAGKSGTTIDDHKFKLSVGETLDIHILKQDNER